MTDEVMNVPEVELPENPVGAAAPEECEEERRPRFSEMNKTELLDALRAIVEGEKATCHHEAQAIKGAYFALRSKETMTELDAFVVRWKARGVCLHSR